MGGGDAGFNELRSRRGVEGSVRGRELEEDGGDVDVIDIEARGAEGAFRPEQGCSHGGLCWRVKTNQCRASGSKECINSRQLTWWLSARPLL